MPKGLQQKWIFSHSFDCCENIWMISQTIFKWKTWIIQFMKLKIQPAFSKIPDRNKAPACLHQTEIYNEFHSLLSFTGDETACVQDVLLLHFGWFWLFISGLCLLCNFLRNGEQPVFSLWWNLGYNSQGKFGGHVAWFDFTTTNISCFLPFDGNGVGYRTCHLSWHLKDKNGIINSANSLQNRASMSKWRTLACFFSILLPASDVRLLITCSRLSKQALPNLSSRPTAPNNTGKFMSEMGSKNLGS